MNKLIAALGICAFAASAASAEQPRLTLEGGPLFGVQFRKPIDPARSATTFSDGRLDVSPPAGITFGFKIEIEVGAGHVPDDCPDDLLFCENDALLF